MAIIIEWKQDAILHCKNAIWGAIFDNIETFISADKLKLNENLSRLLYKLDQNVFGGGAVGEDLADFIGSRQDMLYFAQLIERAFEMWVSENPSLPDNYRDCIKIFHQKLLAIADELPE